MIVASTVLSDYRLIALWKQQSGDNIRCYFVEFRREGFNYMIGPTNMAPKPPWTRFGPGRAVLPELSDQRWP